MRLAMSFQLRQDACCGMGSCLQGMTMPQPKRISAQPHGMILGRSSLINPSVDVCGPESAAEEETRGEIACGLDGCPGLRCTHMDDCRIFRHRTARKVKETQ